jgi:hypothetical protein
MRSDPVARERLREISWLPEAQVVSNGSPTGRLRAFGARDRLFE